MSHKRTAAAWVTIHKLRSGAPTLKRFHTIFASFGSWFWSTLWLENLDHPSSNGKKLDGCYIQMLWMACNVHRASHVTNEDLYAYIPHCHRKSMQRKLNFAGHCYRGKSEKVSKIVLQITTHEQTKQRRLAITYINNLQNDMELELEDISAALRNNVPMESIVR